MVFSKVKPLLIIEIVFPVHEMTITYRVRKDLHNLGVVFTSKHFQATASADHDDSRLGKFRQTIASAISPPNFYCSQSAFEHMDDFMRGFNMPPSANFTALIW